MDFHWSPSPWKQKAREVFKNGGKIRSILGGAAANGGVTNGGLRGVWPPFPEIGRNRPFSPFSGGPEEHLENPENGGKRPFSSDILGFP